MSIKKHNLLLKISLMFIFLFVTFSGYNLDYKDYKVYKSVSAKEILTAKGKSSSGGFKSSGFKSSKPSSSKSKSSSSGYSSGGFKSSDTDGSSKGYNSGSFKNSKDSSTGGYSSGSFKSSTPNADTAPKGDTSKDYKKGGSSAFPVPIPVGGHSSFSNMLGGYFMMKYIVGAIAIVVIAVVCFAIYKKIRNRRQ